MTCLTTTIKEGTAHYVTAVFRDKDNILATPTSIRYRVDSQAPNSEDWVQVSNWTSNLAPSSTETIIIPAASNVMVDEANEFELFRFTLEATYGGGSENIVNYYEYKVENTLSL